MLRRSGWLHHGCTVWTWETLDNYLWHLEHALALCSEYTYRYGREHKCQEEIEWCKEHIPYHLPPGLTPYYLATANCIDYISYYLEYKMSFAKWTRREPPPWAVLQHS